MDILSALEELESVIESSKKPLLQSDKVIVDQETLYRYIDLIRANLPDEIRDAQWVKKVEQRIIDSAREEYDRIIMEAQAKIQRMAEQTEIVRLAKQEAQEILDSAEQTAHELTENAFMYANDIMEKIEKQLTIYYDVVQDGRAEIQQSLRQLQQSQIVPEDEQQPYEEYDEYET